MDIYVTVQIVPLTLARGLVNALRQALRLRRLRADEAEAKSGGERSVFPEDALATSLAPT